MFPSNIHNVFWNIFWPSLAFWVILNLNKNGFKNNGKINLTNWDIPITIVTSLFLSLCLFSLFVSLCISLCLSPCENSGSRNSKLLRRCLIGHSLLNKSDDLTFLYISDFLYFISLFHFIYLFIFYFFIYIYINCNQEVVNYDNFLL